MGAVMDCHETAADSNVGGHYEWPNRGEVVERVAALARAMGGAAKLARAARYNAGSLRGMLHRRRTPGADILAALCRGSGCSAAWLLCGEGPMWPQAGGGAPGDATGRAEQAEAAVAAARAEAEYWRARAAEYRRQLEQAGVETRRPTIGQ